MKKKFLRSLLSAVLALGILFSVPFGSNALIAFFEDLPNPANVGGYISEPWFIMPVYRLSYGGLYPREMSCWDNRFHPDRSISRGNFVSILALTAQAMGKVKDFSGDSSFSDYLKWAKENHILYGKGRKLGENDPLTRQEMAVILIRFKEYMGDTLTDQREDAGYEEFSDKDAVAGWAVESMKECYRLKLLSGVKMKDGSLCLSPERRTTRAEASQAVINYIDAVGFELKMYFGGWTEPDGMYVPG